MAGPEATLRRRVIKALAPLHAGAVENLCAVGWPDVEFIGGTMELKQVAAWPKRPTTPLRVPHFTQLQRNWLYKRARLGGRTWLLLRVGRLEHLLFDGDTAARYLGLDGSTREFLIDSCAARHWPRGLDPLELLRAVDGRHFPIDVDFETA